LPPPATINIPATSSSVPTWWAGQAYQDPAVILAARASAVDHDPR
jgi:hypothetical protein